MVLHVLENEDARLMALPHLECHSAIGLNDDPRGATELLDGTWLVRDRECGVLIAPP